MPRTKRKDRQGDDLFSPDNEKTNIDTPISHHTSELKSHTENSRMKKRHSVKAIRESEDAHCNAKPAPPCLSLGYPLSKTVDWIDPVLVGSGSRIKIFNSNSPDSIGNRMGVDLITVGDVVDAGQVNSFQWTLLHRRSEGDESFDLTELSLKDSGCQIGAEISASAFLQLKLKPPPLTPLQTDLGIVMSAVSSPVQRDGALSHSTGCLCHCHELKRGYTGGKLKHAVGIQLVCPADESTILCLTSKPSPLSRGDENDDAANCSNCGVYHLPGNENVYQRSRPVKHELRVTATQKISGRIVAIRPVYGSSSFGVTAEVTKGTGDMAPDTLKAAHSRLSSLALLLHGAPSLAVHSATVTSPYPQRRNVNVVPVRCLVVSHNTMSGNVEAQCFNVSDLSITGPPLTLSPLGPVRAPNVVLSLSQARRNNALLSTPNGERDQCSCIEVAPVIDPGTEQTGGLFVVVMSSTVESSASSEPRTKVSMLTVSHSNSHLLDESDLSCWDGSPFDEFSKHHFTPTVFQPPTTDPGWVLAGVCGRGSESHTMFDADFAPIWSSKQKVSSLEFRPVDEFDNVLPPRPLVRGGGVGIMTMGVTDAIDAGWPQLTAWWEKQRSEVVKKRSKGEKAQNSSDRVIQLYSYHRYFQCPVLVRQFSSCFNGCNPHLESETGPVSSWNVGFLGKSTFLESCFTMGDNCAALIKIRDSNHGMQPRFNGSSKFYVDNGPASSVAMFQLPVYHSQRGIAPQMSAALVFSLETTEKRAAVYTVAAPSIDQSADHVGQLHEGSGLSLPDRYVLHNGVKSRVHEDFEDFEGPFLHAEVNGKEDNKLLAALSAAAGCREGFTEDEASSFGLKFLATPEMRENTGSRIVSFIESGIIRCDHAMVTLVVTHSLEKVAKAILLSSSDVDDGDAIRLLVADPLLLAYFVTHYKGTPSLMIEAMRNMLAIGKAKEMFIQLSQWAIGHMSVTPGVEDENQDFPSLQKIISFMSLLVDAKLIEFSISCDEKSNEEKGKASQIFIKAAETLAEAIDFTLTDEKEMRKCAGRLEALLYAGDVSTWKNRVDQPQIEVHYV
eukprot:GHVN01012144.1.p1 GENE.GHVN01012144.1~~GHVN01012144.1.p1  ORF type:complete len:1080 (+),score=131.88 GHVN01012144.1:48-3242(+)